MTTLSDQQIADCARNAGFVRPDLVTAIACARAASGGIPAYEHTVWPGPVAWYKGLYGVDLVEWPQYLGADLADPYEASRAAHELFTDHGWSWCPTYRSGAYLHYVDRARAASSQLAAPAVSYDPIGTPTFRRAVEASSHRLSRHVAAITAHDWSH